MDTGNKPHPAVERLGVDDPQQPAKRQYKKPIVSDFVQAAVAFGSPSTYYTCTK